MSLNMFNKSVYRGERHIINHMLLLSMLLLLLLLLCMVLLVAL